MEKKSGDGFETRSSPGSLAVTRRRFSLYVASLSAPFADLHECNLRGVSVRRHFPLTGTSRRRPTNCANLRF